MGLVAFLVGALGTVGVTFGQAPGTAALMLGATFLTLAGAAQATGALRTNAFRFEMLGAAALAWGFVASRLKMLEIDRAAYRIPLSLLGLGAVLLVPAIAMAARFERA